MNWTKQHKAALSSSFIWVVLLAVSLSGMKSDPGPARPVLTFRNTAPGVQYVGSQVCETCHFAIGRSFRKTWMGQSMHPAGDGAGLPLPATVRVARLHRIFSVYRRNGALYQSEYEQKGKKLVFKEEEKLVYKVGAGDNGYSYLVRRGDWLFEAPLSWYAKRHAWGPSPGYESEDLGFSRLIRPGCLGCHSGRARWAAPGSTRLLQPALAEPAIGCERCHGPGSLHVAEREKALPLRGGYDSSIVNPARLPMALADNICMSCHQEGDAQVLPPGKRYGDFRPGTPLARSLALFELPPGKGQKPDSVLVHYASSLHLSRCYLASNGHLGCLTCHDPHVQPAAAEAPAWFRSRCLTCHSETSCKLPPARRQAMHPADNCVGCHMPRRKLAANVVAHSALTDHRIERTPNEPLPRVPASLQSPGLIDLDPAPSAPLSPLTLLAAYEQLLPQHPQLAPNFVGLLRKLVTTSPNDPAVLAALARDALLAVPPRRQQAIVDLEGELRTGRLRSADDARERQLLARLLIQQKQPAEATHWLMPAATKQVWNARLILLLGQALLQAHHPAQAVAWLQQGLNWSPQSDQLRALLQQARHETQAK